MGKEQKDRHFWLEETMKIKDVIIEKRVRDSVKYVHVFGV